MRKYLAQTTQVEVIGWRAGRMKAWIGGKLLGTRIMTQKHDSMYSWQNCYKNQNKYPPILKLQILNSLLFAAFPSDVMKHFYTLILFYLWSSFLHVSMWINCNFTESISGPLKYGFLKRYFFKNKPLTVEYFFHQN